MAQQKIHEINSKIPEVYLIYYECICINIVHELMNKIKYQAGFELPVKCIISMATTASSLDGDLQTMLTSLASLEEKAGA